MATTLQELDHIVPERETYKKVDLESFVVEFDHSLVGLHLSNVS